MAEFKSKPLLEPGAKLDAAADIRLRPGTDFICCIEADTVVGLTPMVDLTDADVTVLTLAEETEEEPPELANDLTKAAALSTEDEDTDDEELEDLSPLGLAAVALFNVDILGFPDEPCLGECVPNGDFGLFEAVLCLGLLYTGEDRADKEDPVTEEANKPPEEPLGEDEGEENLRATAEASLEPAGEFWRENIFSGGPIGESSLLFLRFLSFWPSEESSDLLEEDDDDACEEDEEVFVLAEFRLLEEDFLSLLPDDEEAEPVEVPAFIGVMVMVVDALLFIGFGGILLMFVGGLFDCPVSGIISILPVRLTSSGDGIELSVLMGVILTVFFKLVVLSFHIFLYLSAIS